MHYDKKQIEFIGVEAGGPKKSKRHAAPLTYGSKIGILHGAAQYANQEKISVGVKQLTEDPYAKSIDKYEIGKTYEAIITKVQDYGCFARLEEGLEGLIHQSELSWTKKNILSIFLKIILLPNDFDIFFEIVP